MEVGEAVIVVIRRVIHGLNGFVRFGIAIVPSVAYHQHIMAMSSWVFDRTFVLLGRDHACNECIVRS